MGLKEQKKEKIRKELEEIMISLEKDSKKGQRLNEVELSLFRSLLQLGLQLLMDFLTRLDTKIS